MQMSSFILSIRCAYKKLSREIYGYAVAALEIYWRYRLYLNIQDVVDILIILADAR